ncbi:MAG: hypothetical protein M3340_17390 [Actinomycetota bacterium]|nr:hypothetical protein [Actinomycetota bacterium]
MTAAWDTTVASRLSPGSEVAAHVAARALTDDPVRIAAPAILEVAYGYERAAATDARFRNLLGWFTGLVAGGDIVDVPLDARAAVVAGRMRAASPGAPPERKGEKRSKTMRQAAWLLDIQIAATAFAGGLDVATENRSDFEKLSELLVRLFPEAPPLGVVEPPV